MLGLFALLLPALAVADDLPAYRWLREIEVPELNSVTPVAVPLDSHFFHATRDGWPDVRLSNEAGQPVAFLIRAAHATQTRTARRFWPAEQQAAKVDAAVGLQVELALRDKEPVPHGLRIATPLRDFEHQVRIESSADGANWAADGPAVLIFDYSRYVDARNVLIPFAAGDRRRFRLIVADVTAEQESQLLELARRLRGSDETDRLERTTIERRPFRIDGVEFYRDETQSVSSELQTTEYSALDFDVTEDEQDHQTLAAFHTKLEPITQVQIVTGDENFSRAASVEAEIEDVHGKLVWQPLTKGMLTRFSVGTIRREELTLSIRETRAKRYRVVIENRDSPPLDITGVELVGPLYEVTFLVSPRKKLTMEYGSSTAKPGRYDTAALQAALAPGQKIAAAALLAPRENQAAPADRGRPWQPWNDPRVLLGGILFLALLLGWGLFRAGRRLDPPSTPN